MATLLLLGACSPAPTPICSVSERRFDHFVVAGLPASVTLGIREECSADDPNLHTASSAHVEVFDPDGVPVPFVASSPSRSPGGRQFENKLTVSFTPDQPGTWRLKAQLKPSIGNTEQVVEAVAVRQDAGASVVSAGALPTDCVQYASTSSATAWCGHFVDAGRFEVVANTGLALAGRAAAFDRNFVWRVGLEAPEALELFRDDGATVARVAAAPLSTSSKLFLVAADGGLWSLSTGRTLDDEPGSLSFAQPMPDGGITISTYVLPRFVAFGVGIHAGRVLLAGFSDAGTVVLAVVPDGGVQQTRSSGPFVVGASGSDLWLATHTELLGSGAAGPLALPGIEWPFPPFASPWSPAIPLDPQDGSSNRAFPFVRDGKVYLEAFDPGPGFKQVRHATPTHAFARSDDGSKLKIISREK